MTTSTITLIRKLMIDRLTRLDKQYKDNSFARDQAAENSNEPLYKEYNARMGQILLEMDEIRAALKDFLTQEWATATNYPKKRKVDIAADREIYNILEGGAKE